MPSSVVKTDKDERLWKDAKKIAIGTKLSNGSVIPEDESKWTSAMWAYVMGIFKKMSGKKANTRGPIDTDLFQCTDRKCGYQARYKDVKPSLECPECKKKNKKSPMYNTEEEKTAAIVECLDKIADEVQVFDEKLALEIDKITDDIESSF